MRCPDCNKFVGFEEGEPEVESVEVSTDGAVTAEVRIMNNCAECGQELTEATLEMEATVEVPEEHKGEGHELSAEEAGCERTSRSGYFDKGKFIPKGGRYAKTFYGASLTVKVSCECGKWDDEVTMEDEVQASGMDSLV